MSGEGGEGGLTHPEYSTEDKSDEQYNRDYSDKLDDERCQILAVDHLLGLVDGANQKESAGGREGKVLPIGSTTTGPPVSTRCSTLTLAPP